MNSNEAEHYKEQGQQCKTKMNTHTEQQVKKLKHRVMRGLVLRGPS